MWVTGGKRRVKDISKFLVKMTTEKIESHQLRWKDCRGGSLQGLRVVNLPESVLSDCTALSLHICCTFLSASPAFPLAQPCAKPCSGAPTPESLPSHHSSHSGMLHIPFSIFAYCHVCLFRSTGEYILSFWSARTSTYMSLLG